MRRKFVWSPEHNKLIEVETSWTQRPRGHFVQPDLPGYRSPVTGLWVEGRKQRRNDLARTGSRPWEGMEQERKEAARHQAYAEQSNDKFLDRAVRETYYQMSPEKRRRLERGE
jgi:hypothetical protein